MGLDFTIGSTKKKVFVDEGELSQAIPGQTRVNFERLQFLINLRW